MRAVDTVKICENYFNGFLDVYDHKSVDQTIMGILKILSYAFILPAVVFGSVYLCNRKIAKIENLWDRALDITIQDVSLRALDIPNGWGLTQKQLTRYLVDLVDNLESEQATERFQEGFRKLSAESQDAFFVEIFKKNMFAKVLDLIPRDAKRLCIRSNDIGLEENAELLLNALREFTDLDLLDLGSNESFQDLRIRIIELWITDNSNGLYNSRELASYLAELVDNLESEQAIEHFQNGFRKLSDESQDAFFVEIFKKNIFTKALDFIPLDTNRLCIQSNDSDLQENAELIVQKLRMFGEFDLSSLGSKESCQNLRLRIIETWINDSPYLTYEGGEMDILKIIKTSLDEVHRFEAVKILVATKPFEVISSNLRPAIFNHEFLPSSEQHFEVMKIALNAVERYRYRSTHLDGLGLSADQYFELLKIVFEKDFSAIEDPYNFTHYGISDEQVFQLVKISVGYGRFGWDVVKYVGKFTNEKFAQLVEVGIQFGVAYRRMTNESLCGKMVAYKKKLIADDKDLFASLCQDAERQDDPDLRRQLSDWIDSQQSRYVLMKKRTHILSFADYKKNLKSKDDKACAETFSTLIEGELIHFRSLIEEIYDSRSPEQRESITRLINHRMNDINQVSSYRRTLSNPEARHSFIPTFLAMQITKDRDVLRHFSVRVASARTFLRYGQNMRLLNSFLLALIASEIDPAHKTMILQQIFRNPDENFAKSKRSSESSLTCKPKSPELKQLFQEEEKFLADRLRILNCFLTCNKENQLINDSYLPNDTLKIKLQSLREELLGLKISDYGSVEAFATLYKERIENEFRDEDALFVYAGKINTLHSIEKDVLFAAYSGFVNSLLSGTFQKLRQSSPHLQELTRLAPNPSLAVHWARDHRRDLEEFFRDEVRAEAPFSEMWQKLLFEKIHTDRHIAAPESTLPHLWKVFQGERPEVILKELSESKEKRNAHNDLQKCCLQLCMAETALEGLAALEKLKLIFNEISDLDLSQFKRDIAEFERGLKASKKSGDYTNWTVGVTEDPCDMLLLARETAGCQSIDGSPDLNKHALAYVIDGKNKALFIKNEEGRIKVRAVIRLLWDEVAKAPALFLERHYASVFDERLHAALDAFSIDYAKHLGLPLYTEKMVGNGDGKSGLSAILHSFGSNAPFEYSDAAGGRTNGIFEINININ